MQNFKRSLIVALALVLGCPVAGHAQSANSPKLKCETGPINRTYGGAEWLLYSCADGLSLSFLAAQGSPAMPSYFLITPQEGNYHLIGEATGDLTVSNAAEKEIQALTKQDVTDLIAATKAAHAKP